MVTLDAAVRQVLDLPEVVERDHHGRRSFRVGGRILTTVWSPRELNVMAGEARILAAAAAHPEACSEVRWGGRVSAVRVALDRVDAELLEDLLDHAWRRAAPGGAGEPPPLRPELGPDHCLTTGGARRRPADRVTV